MPSIFDNILILEDQEVRFLRLEDLIIRYKPTYDPLEFEQSQISNFYNKLSNIQFEQAGRKIKFRWHYLSKNLHSENHEGVLGERVFLENKNHNGEGLPISGSIYQFQAHNLWLRIDCFQPIEVAPPAFNPHVEEGAELMLLLLFADPQVMTVSDVAIDGKLGSDFTLDDIDLIQEMIDSLIADPTDMNVTLHLFVDDIIEHAKRSWENLPSELHGPYFRWPFDL